MKPLLSPKSLSLDQISSLLQRITKQKSLEHGKQLHSILLTTGADMKSTTRSLNSKLVGFYASCGNIQTAKLVLSRTQNPNVYALNWIMSSLAFNGFYENAIEYFNLMQELKVMANKYTYSILVKACVGLYDVRKGKEMHCAVIKMGFENVVMVCNALVDMYSKCGSLLYSRNMFDGMLERDVASWTIMICAYCNVEDVEQGLVLFEGMKLEGLKPNEFTWNAMIAGCARKGECEMAYELFCRMSEEGLGADPVTWNVMISGFVQCEKGDEAMEIFRRMVVKGVRLNSVTVTGLLPACGLTSSVQRGREIHGIIYRMEIEINVFIASALIDMYSKCGNIFDARNVFNQVPVKNVACWNAMIGCYGKNGNVELAIKLFEQMQEEGMQANHVTLVCVLSACSHGGLVEKGLQIFRLMKEVYFVEVSKEHYACVVDLLCRSGRIDEASKLVKDMPVNITESIAGAFFNGCNLHERRDLGKMMANDILKMQLKKPGGLVTLSNIYAADEEWENVWNVRNIMREKGISKNPGLSNLRKERKRSEVGAHLKQMYSY